FGEDDPQTSDVPIEISVPTVWGHEVKRFEGVTGTNVLAGDSLDRSVRPTLGETLEREAGVHSTSYSPGASRPVIRGYDGPRVRVLQNGVGTLDASTASPDHSVAVEPLLADRIEVLRGGGALRYGTSAIGGVVNIRDGRIPSDVPRGGASAAFRSGYGSNADERNLAGALRLGTGHFAFQGEGFLRETHNLELSGDDIPNTDVKDNRGGSLGGSFIWEGGHVGVAVSGIESNYGLGGDDDVRIDLDQERFDIAGELRGDFGFFRSLSFNGAYGDYEHTELEGAEAGTVFKNNEFEGRAELRHRHIGNLEGVWGVQWNDREFEAIGEEAFVPKTDTQQWALFAVEQYALGRHVALEASGRFEHTDHDPRTGGSESFSTLSALVGASYRPLPGYVFGINLGRTERPPSVEELFSNGPHLATRGFEVGNSDLDPEVAWSVDASVKKDVGRLRGGINLFYTRFDDFIFQEFTGDIEDDLPVRRYIQRDASFYGAELELLLRAFESKHVQGLLDVHWDYVRASERGGGSLPRIAPMRLRIGAEARNPWAEGRVELVHVFAQDRTAAFETRTSDYSLINASLTFRPVPNRHDLRIVVQGRNLSDQRARNHISFLKDDIPLSGRDIRVLVAFDY
ncbi:MAG: TonB-dependent receptor, partial [Myxococcales bacterium]|nr:TonB-dependent receptor [Myxococcales bacterium]